MSALQPRPAVAEVERIAAVSDPVLRNLQITQCYHDLSTDLAARLGPSANWCTFATWASKQAGRTIRREDLRRAIEEKLAASTGMGALGAAVTRLARRAGSRVDAAAAREPAILAFDPAAALDRASAAVARGNLKVFAEIGREFARFGSVFLDAGDLEGFCAGLRAGEPPDGQTRLVTAFRAYARALTEAGAKRRAEALLLANLEIGFHEQTRLQPEIAKALDAGTVDPRVFTRRLIRGLFPRSGAVVLGCVSAARMFGGLAWFDDAVDRFLADARRAIRERLTEHLMTLAVPGGALRLGADLRGTYPRSLARIEDAELRTLLTRIDPTPDSFSGTVATDWADLGERMHFIADLFRGWQETAGLRDPPFSAEQQAALRRGVVPAGDL